MWIAKTNFGLKRFVGILFLLSVLPYINLSATNGNTLFFAILLITYIGLVFYNVYDRGLIIRIKKFSVGKTKYEVRLCMYFKSSQLSTKSIVITPSGAILSSIPLATGGEWTYFPFITTLLNNHQIKRALVLGGGGGAIPYMLLRHGICLSVDTVEKYACMISIAKQYMLPKPLPTGLHLIHNDAKKYLSKTIKPFDLIIVDIFEGTVPQLVWDKQFISSIKRSLRKDGILIVNFGFKEKTNITELEQLYSNTISNFSLYYINNAIIGISNATPTYDRI